MLTPTLQAIRGHNLDQDVGAIHLDKGYDATTVRSLLIEYGYNEAVIDKKRRPGDPRSTDRTLAGRNAQICLAVTFIIAAKLIDYRDAFNL